jgi:hypothetical protein
MAEILEAVKLALKESNESIQASNKQSVGFVFAFIFYNYTYLSVSIFFRRHWRFNNN